MKKLKSFGITLGICYITILVLFLITAAIFTYTNINDNYLDIFVYVIMGISTFISSIILNKKVKQKGAMYGSIFGILVMLVIYLTSSIFFTGFKFTTVTAIFFAITAISGMIGGIIGVNV